jgi:dihydropteroate synthase
MKNTLKIGDRLMNLTEPTIMGILNVTPDSFYKDSRYNPNREEFLQKATEMVTDGVDIFDVGGYSTRPGGQEISVQEEIRRITPAIQKLKLAFPHIPVSIDTFRAEVASAALDSGAEIVNDISGGDFDKDMENLIISKKPVYILMHLNGSLHSMHAKVSYSDFYPEILNHLFKKANTLRSKGVSDIVIDPGFGFSKDVNQNYAMLSNLELFNTEHYPILIGMSRKSMIYKILNTTPENTLTASSFLHGLGVLKGAKIIRVHDVRPIKEIIRISKLVH